MVSVICFYSVGSILCSSENGSYICLFCVIYFSIARFCDYISLSMCFCALVSLVCGFLTSYAVSLQPNAVHTGCERCRVHSAQPTSVEGERTLFVSCNTDCIDVVFNQWFTTVQLAPSTARATCIKVAGVYFSHNIWFNGPCVLKEH